MYNVNAGGDYMIIDLIRLKNNIEKTIEIDNNVDIPESLIKETELIGLKELHVEGYLKKDLLDLIVLSLNIKGVMVLPCAVTLKPVDHAFETSIEGDLEEILKEMDENFKNIENSIDILPIIWENVLMEIPLRVVSEEGKKTSLQGEGWKLTNANDAKEVNPELAKLKDLL
jgi:uncharacterized protein